MELRVEEITKNYGSRCVVDHISLELGAGIYGFLGANGAGKSTLVNMIVGNLEPDYGRVLCNGKNIKELNELYREQIGFMPQQQEMYDFFTGYRFLSYIARLKGLDEKNIDDEIKNVLSLVNLSDSMNKKIGQYSGGMKQRLLLAQALLGSPKLIILDEPTAGLDPKERIRMKNIISKYAMEKIVIIVTHIVSDIEYIAREIVIFKEGKVVEKGTPEELLSTMEGKVFEILTDEEELDLIQSSMKVSSIRKEGDKVYVRIIADRMPENYECKKVRPTLEEKYLYIFDEANV